MASEEAGPVRVTHVSGLAGCTVCGQLVSWKVPWGDLDKLKDVPCPTCKAPCTIHPHTGVPLFETASGIRVVD